MVTGPLLIVIFLLSILLLLFIIIKLKVNPFLALLLICILTGFAVRMPAEEITANTIAGFGNTLKGIGIVIGLGIILGKILSKSGAAETISRSLISRVGKKNAPLALSITGLLVSIPVFFDAGFVILSSLVKSIGRLTKIPLVTLFTALSIGLIVSHNMIVPTPGPVDVGETLELGFGSFAFWAIIVSVPAVLVGGLLYGRIIGRSKSVAFQESGEEIAGKEEQKLPGAFRSYFSLLLPIILILTGNIMNLFIVEGSWFYRMFAFIGDKNIALLASVFVAIVLLRKYILQNTNALIIEAAEASGMILLITGAGGAFGYIVNQSGIGDYLVTTMTELNIPLLVTCFLLAAILRGAQGSSTVSLVASSTILGPVILQSGVSPLMAGLAICAGGICLSLPNDSAFWVVSRFSGMTVQQTLKSWTLGSTLAGLVGLIVVLVINSFI